MLAPPEKRKRRGTGLPAEEATMRRRDVIALLGGGLASLPRIVHAQSAKPARIGVLWHAGNAREEGPYFEALRQGFRELGYEEGRTITLEHRFHNE